MMDEETQIDIYVELKAIAGLSKTVEVNSLDVKRRAIDLKMKEHLKVIESLNPEFYDTL